MYDLDSECQDREDGLAIKENMPTITSRSIELTTPWFDLVAKKMNAGDPPYYSLRMPDYVTVLALTGERQVVLVRQYRPAVERYTLELPGGHVDNGENPEQSARRELTEETGFQAEQMELLGSLLSDSGRHENKLWCYLAPSAMRVDGFCRLEPGIEVVLVGLNDLFDMVCKGEYDHAPHLAVLLLAMAKHGRQLINDFR